MYFRDRQEGQFDLGLVTRFRKNLQAGVFSSFRTVNLREHDNNGTLGQASFTLDWLLRRGKVGLFGSKGFLDEAVISRRKISPSFTLETFLKTVDQVGASGTWQLWKNNFVEGNFGYLHGRGVASRPGGTLRFVFPVNDLVALTLEGGMNETLLGRGQNGRVVGGVLFGNFMQPRQFLDAGGPVPVDIPRVRYEVLTRRVRTGFAAPVADAGPDQIGVAAGTIQLDGSGSYHPDGLPLAYQWTQIAGNSVAISGVNSVRATFRGEEGQSYAFRLTVRDPDGAVGIARTVVTTRAEPDVRIVQFVANPAIIRPGQSASLAWQVDNAEEVSLQGIGRVDAKAGTVSVSPAETTTYRLTARNRKGEINSTVTVSVERQVARVLNFSASPMTITAGETSTLSWSTENAETVEISGLGRVAIAGNQQVSPTQTTTYTITVRNRSGDTAATVTVQVVPRPMPRILRFLAAPPEIFSGETSTLIWSVENADEVSITSVGIVESSGTNAVAPTQNTTYTLTARNAAGEVRATASVNVFGPPRILSFTGNPLTIKVGETATLAWATADATSVSLTGAGAVEPSGSVPVKPTQTTTYTLTATGRRGNQVSQQVIINVTTDPAPPGGGGPVGTRPPVANAGPDQTTTQRTITLDGSRSFHPDGKLIRFSWRVLNLKGVQEFRGTDTARPTVIFAEYAAYGEYVFELTVTDQDGRFSTSTTRVTYYAY
jgi:plastocyanin